ncbi:MAG TPA: hypothetical protein VGB94_06525 [Acidobacteriaceae bacterium]
MKTRRLVLVLTLLLSEASSLISAQEMPTQYHLAAHAWSPLNISKQRYLDALEGVCRFAVKHQDADGALIDPSLHHEVQYATPHFAYAVGTFVRAGRDAYLLPNGIATMEHSTRQFSLGRSSIPDGHGEFFIPALAESLGIYRSLVPQSTIDIWQQRLRGCHQTGYMREGEEFLG